MTRLLPATAGFSLLPSGAWLAAPLTRAIACGTKDPGPNALDSTGGDGFVLAGGAALVNSFYGGGPQ